jgi:hypothetical protein
MAEKTNADRVSLRAPKIDYFEDLGAAGRILKWVLKEYDTMTFTAFI